MDRRLKFTKGNYSLLTAVPSIVYFYGLFPGRIYSDSASLIELMRAGQSSDQWSALYFRYLQMLTVNGRFLFIAAAFNLLFLTFSVFRFIKSLRIDERVKKTTFLILACSPFVGVFGMTVGRDTVATSGILLLTSQLIQFSEGKSLSSWSQKIIFSISIIFASMSIVGSVFLLTFSLIFFFKSRRLLSVTIFIFVTFNLTLMTTALQVSHYPEKLYLANVLGDMKCIAQHPDAVISEIQWEELSKLGSVELWKEPKSCWLADYSYFALKSASLNSGDTLSLWKNLFMQNPQISIISRVQRSSVALPPILFSPPPNMISMDYSQPVGLGTQDDLQKFSELFKTSVDSEYFKESELPQQAPIQSLLLFITLILNQNSQLWGWAGLWLSVCLLFGRRFTILPRVDFVLVLLPIISTHFLLVLASPAPNPRYLMASTLIGIVVVVARIAVKFQSSKD